MQREHPGPERPERSGSEPWEPTGPFPTRGTPGQDWRHRRAWRRILTAVVLVTLLLLLFRWLPASSRHSLLSGLIANRLLIGWLVVFGLIAVSLLWAAGQRLDVRLLTALNVRGWHSGRMDRVMWWASQGGSAKLTTGLVIASYLLGGRGFAVELALGSLTLSLLVILIKIVTDRARPFLLLRETRVIGAREAGLSFPSGHTTQAFFLTTIGVRYLEAPFPVALGFYGLAVVVGYTRVYLGVHYPRDVIAGAVLGLIWGGLSLLFAPYL